MSDDQPITNDPTLTDNANPAEDLSAHLPPDPTVDEHELAEAIRDAGGDVDGAHHDYEGPNSA